MAIAKQRSYKFNITLSNGTNIATAPFTVKDGDGFRWLGEWAANNQYYKNDVVGFRGSSYICIVDDTSSNNNPSIDTTHWQVMCTSIIPVNVYFNRTQFSGQTIVTYNVCCTVFDTSLDWTNTNMKSKLIQIISNHGSSITVNSNKYTYIPAVGIYTSNNNDTLSNAIIMGIAIDNSNTLYLVYQNNNGDFEFISNINPSNFVYQI